MARRQTHPGSRKPTTRSENLRTIAQIAEQSPAFSEAALRKMILRAPFNGLEPSIVRLGRRVLIDEESFNEWLNRHRGLPA